MTNRETEFDSLLISQVRLGVVSVLMSRKQATFSDLRIILGLTQGNLGAHLKKLEQAKYIEVQKEFVNRTPKTTCVITDKGRKAFIDHVKQLESIAKSGS